MPNPDAGKIIKIKLRTPDNFELAETNFAFSMQGKSSVKEIKLMENPNILDFAVNGEYNNFDWGNLFKKKDDEVTAPTPSGQPAAPTPFYPTPTGEAPSKSSGGGNIGDKISPEGVEAGLLLLGGLLSKKELSEVEGVCGKQPHPIIGGKAKKAAWQQCAANYAQSKSKTEKQSGIGAGTIAAIAIGSIVLIGGIIFIATSKKPQQIVVQQTPIPSV